MRTPRFLAAVAASTLAVGTLAAAPSVAAEPSGRTLARHLVGPLSVAVEGDDVYVTQNFAGVLNKLRPGRSPKTLYASTGGNEVGGVSVRNGRVVFTETASDAEGNPADSWVKRLTRSGKVRTIAHVRAFENRKNPDGDVAYGARGISDECAAQWPTAEAGPATYTGLPDSHPYATYQTRRKVYVADAGMNAVLAVSRWGRIRTVAVLPAVPVKITQELATAMHLPDCAVGLTYYGEPVPTDVEQGPDGKLYVTTEGGGLGEQLPLGSVYRINPETGKVTKVVGGLFTPTGLAVTPRGTMFVAQLFAGEISKIRKGSTKVRPFVRTALPAAVQLSGGDVYATTHALPPEKGAPDGRVVRYRR
jgi:hypothetical protein